MKKYKLKKWYPSLPSWIKEGNIVLFDMNASAYKIIKQNKCWYLTTEEVENNPEYWEEVIEKDYEILSYKNIASGNIYKRIDEYNYKSEFGNHIHPNNSLPNQINIHSIKRLSDGKVFTVGDKVCIGSGKPQTIKRFETWGINSKQDSIRFRFEDGRGALLKLYPKPKHITHYKEPLFTTEDGMDIYEGDKYYSASLKSKKVFCWKGTKDRSHLSPSDKTFSTEEKAKEYIEEHKPRYSKNDIKEALRKSFTGSNGIIMTLNEQQFSKTLDL